MLSTCHFIYFIKKKIERDGKNNNWKNINNNNKNV